MAKSRLLKEPEYRSWAGMNARCRQPKNKLYRYYGGRGITICERWRDYRAFREDMGPRPSPDHSIDRIDNNGNYEPGNCRWATRAEQSRNRNFVTLHHYRGSLVTLAQAAEMAGAGVPYKIAHQRMQRSGWDLRRAIETPTSKISERSMEAAE
jgi:hypothetical protein